MFKLTEARLLRQEEIDMAATEDAINKRMISSRRALRKKQLSAGGLIGKLFDSVHSSHKKDHDCDSFEDSCGDKLMQLSSFVKKDTKDLPDIEPSRRRRRKAVSDGVSAMRFFTPLSSSVKEALEGDMESEFDNLRHRSIELSKSIPKSYSTVPSRPHRLKSASTGIFTMRHGGSEAIFSDSSDKNANLTHFKSRDDNDIDMFSSSVLSRVDEGKPISKAISVGESKTKVSSMSKTSTNLEHSSLSNHTNSYIPKSGSEHKKILAFMHPTNEELAEDPIESQVESDMESTGFPDLSDHPSFQFDNELEIPLSDRMKSFFMDLKYRRLSAVFGTLLVFFLLGTRMELILLKTCKIEGKSSHVYPSRWSCANVSN